MLIILGIHLWMSVWIVVCEGFIHPRAGSHLVITSSKGILSQHALCKGNDLKF